MKESKHPVVGRIVGLVLVSVFAVAIMLASGTKWLATGKRTSSGSPRTAHDGPVGCPRASPGEAASSENRSKSSIATLG